MPMKNRIDEMMDDVRAVVSEYGDLPESQVYEALLAEADDWGMLLQELAVSEPTFTVPLA